MPSWGIERLSMSEKLENINFFNFIWVLIKLNREISAGEADANTYLKLSLLTSMLFLKGKSFKYALKALRMDKTDPMIWYACGAACREYKDSSLPAKKYFLKSFELGGENFYYGLYELIFIAADEGDSLARDKYEKSFMKIKTEKSSGYLLRRAFIYQGHAQLKEAFSDFYEALKCRIFERGLFVPDLPSFVTFLFHIFVTWLFKTIHPDWRLCTEALFNLDAGREEDGIQMLLEAAEICKNKAEKEGYYKTLLDYFNDKEEYKKCIDAANRILIKYRYVDAYGYKAYSYRELGEFEKSREALHLARKAGTQELTESTYYNSLALTYFCEGKYDKAINWLNKQIISSPSAHPFLYKGFCLEELNEFDDAIKAYNKSLEYKADDLAYYRVANLYYIKSDYENALKSINQGLLLNKDSYNYNLKGDILTAMRRIKEARFCYKLAEGLD